MRRGDWKWILHPRGNRCFDLREDPFEERGGGCDAEGFVEARRWARQIEKEGEALEVSQFEPDRVRAVLEIPRREYETDSNPDR